MLIHFNYKSDTCRVKMHPTSTAGGAAGCVVSLQLNVVRLKFLTPSELKMDRFSCSMHATLTASYRISDIPASVHLTVYLRQAVYTNHNFVSDVLCIIQPPVHVRDETKE